MADANQCNNGCPRCPFDSEADSLSHCEKRKPKNYYDLIYVDSSSEYVKAKIQLKQVFPSCTIEDGSDEIHHYRFAINIPEITEEAYFSCLLNLELALCSLAFNLAMRHKTSMVKRLIEQWKGEPLDVQSQLQCSKQGS